MGVSAKVGLTTLTLGARIECQPTHSPLLGAVVAIPRPLGRFEQTDAAQMELGVAGQCSSAPRIVISLRLALTHSRSQSSSSQPIMSP